MEKLIDLHIHTICSDGEKTPFEIIDMAKDRETLVNFYLAYDKKINNQLMSMLYEKRYDYDSPKTISLLDGKYSYPKMPIFPQNFTIRNYYY